MSQFFFLRGDSLVNERQKEQLHVDDTIALIRREQMVLAQQKRTWLQKWRIS